MNFYKRFMGDFARKTAHLTLVERGAYDSMLDHYYSTETAMPADMGSLYRIAGAMSAPERKAVEKIATEFFPINGDGLRHNKRADEEITRHQSQASINREIGKRGGRPRKTESVIESETESVIEQKPNRNPSHSQSNTRSKEAADAADVTIWELGVKFMVSRGVPEKQVRSLLGAHYKRDRQKLASAVGTMLQTQPIGPVEYLQRMMTPEPKRVASG